MIKTSNNKRYLADICFPNLSLYVEIDELQHSKLEHSESDKDRMEEILDVSNFLEKRIQIFTAQREIKSLGEINSEIWKIVKFIKKRKEEFVLKKFFQPWNFDKKYDPEKYISLGYLDSRKNVSFLYHRDALRCFGYKGGHFQKAGHLLLYLVYQLSLIKYFINFGNFL